MKLEIHFVENAFSTGSSLTNILKVCYKKIYNDPEVPKRD